MKNRVKKISSFVFLLSAMTPVMFTLFFLCKQQWVRHEMKEKLEKERLHTVVIPESEVQWVKNKKEIRVHGKMFDIKSFNVKQGKYTFTGLFDEEETALNDFLKEKAHNEQENHMLASILKMLHSVYAVDANNTLVTGRIPRVYSPHILQHTCSPFKNILTPPPQAVIREQV